jgi:hypothetical protein
MQDSGTEEDRKRMSKVHWNFDIRIAQFFLDWFRILRTQYHWPLFEVIRFALWLGRQ